MRSLRTNLAVPASSPLGHPNTVQDDGAAANSSISSTLTTLRGKPLTFPATSYKRRKICQERILLLPGPLGLSHPFSLHSCSGKDWDMSNPCEACINAAWSEQVGFGARTQPDESVGPFIRRVASASEGTPCKDPGGSCSPPPPPPLGVRGPRGPSSSSSPMACSSHRNGKGWSLQDPSRKCLQLALEANLHDHVV